jgi:hypothetical protein
LNDDELNDDELNGDELNDDDGVEIAAGEQYSRDTTVL